jgi:hypothetical protein
MNLDKKIKLFIKAYPNDSILGAKVRMLYSERKRNTIKENKTTRS